MEMVRKEYHMNTIFEKLWYGHLGLVDEKEDAFVKGVRYVVEFLIKALGEKS